MKQILDHGYVTLVETWGSDEQVIASARMSTSKGFLGWGETCAECGWSKGEDHDVGCSQPERYKPGENRHSTPFEFGGLTIEIQAPIFVFREWHRHRTQSYSELSARYTPMPDFDYVPQIGRLLLNAANGNKQAGTVAGADELNADTARAWRAKLEALYAQAQRVYTEGLAIGVPKELARCAVPVARYSRMRASANLRNWLQFLELRLPSNAQWEIRQYANAVSGLVQEAFPRTHALFMEGIK